MHVFRSKEMSTYYTYAVEMRTYKQTHKHLYVIFIESIIFIFFTLVLFGGGGF